jgi:hypothetical protein
MNFMNEREEMLYRVLKQDRDHSHRVSMEGVKEILPFDLNLSYNLYDGLDAAQALAVFLKLVDQTEITGKKEILFLVNHRNYLLYRYDELQLETEDDMFSSYSKDILYCGVIN